MIDYRERSFLIIFPSSAFADVPLKDLFLSTCESLLDIVFQNNVMTLLKTNLLIKRLNTTVIH